MMNRAKEKRMKDFKQELDKHFVDALKHLEQVKIFTQAAYHTSHDISNELKNKKIKQAFYNEFITTLLEVGQKLHVVNLQLNAAADMHKLIKD